MTEEKQNWTANAVEQALAALAAGPKRRHAIEQIDRDRIGYGRWRVDHDRSPPVPCGAWVWWHAKHEHLEGREHSLAAALDECDRLEEENHTEDTTPCVSCGKLPGYPCYSQCPNSICAHAWEKSADGAFGGRLQRCARCGEVRS
jgi:hypothetical protein